MSRVINVGPVTAYGLAVKNGFVGTEREWLESLHDHTTWVGTKAEYDALPAHDEGTIYYTLEEST